MYVNDRDQINYHGFLTALRTMRGYVLKDVSTGVCCESGMNRFEKGNRVAEKLVRDRLTARLGVSCEKYEDYLQPREYVRWEQRLRIIKAIEKRNLNDAKQELEKYEKFPSLNRTNQQFVEAMRYTILALDGATEAELYACIKKAVKLTVPNIQKALAGEHLLADQEINLILEQMRLETPKKAIADEKMWRIAEYEKLISYMDNSCWEKLQKAKVYPKVVYYICTLLLSKDLTEPEIRRGLELCHTAIELLRDTSRLYYFIELTECRRALATHLMALDVSAGEHAQLEEMLDENNQWEVVFKDLYAEYKVAPYMSDFCFLYYENECHDMVEVIETRRNMLGLSRAKLGEDICSEKTIIRFEREGVNPSIELVRRLFDKMGMCAEYRRGMVITTDVNALMLWNEVTRNMNDCAYEIWEMNLNRLKSLLSMSIPHNRQEVMRLETIMSFKKGIIGKNELFESTKKALEYTLSLEALEKSGKKYLTRNEILFVYDFAFKTMGEFQEISLRIVKEYCDEKVENSIVSDTICVLEIVASVMASYLGDVGSYSDSNKWSNVLLKECLINRRMGVLADVLYNKIWNYQQQSSINHLDKEYVKHSLSRCVLLCKIAKEYNWQAFFQNKEKDYD